MFKENQADLFMRLLVEEFEAYQKIKKSGSSRQFRVQAKRLRQLSRSNHNSSVGSMEPLDCLQLMSTAP